MSGVAMPDSAEHVPIVDAIVAAIAAVALLITGGGLLLPLGGVGVALSQILFVAGPAILLAARRKNTLARLGFRNPGAGVFAGSILIGSSLWFITLWLIAPLAEQWFDTSDLETLEQAAESLSMPVLLASFAVAPAICEEILFRGVLARSLSRHIGPVAAVAVSAVLFAGFHGSAVRLLPTLFIGLALGAVCVRSRSVLPAMVIHGLNNGIALSISDRGGDWLDANSASLGVAAFGLTGAGLWLVWWCSRSED